jgi:hypothetical protein
MKTLPALLLAAVAASAACGGSSSNIPGTKVPRTAENEAILERVEAYRLAVERKDAPALLLMAGKAYWDDAGTPTGEDDYGVVGLKAILAGRFQRVKDVRYAMKYVTIKHQGRRAFVDVLIDASYSMTDAREQDVRHDMRDQNQLVLEWDGERWMFVSGM